MVGRMDGVVPMVVSCKKRTLEPQSKVRFLPDGDNQALRCPSNFSSLIIVSRILNF